MSTPAFPPKKPKRMAARTRAVLVYFPEPLIAEMDRAAVKDDTDRSKWLRSAAREALRRRGIPA